MAYALRALHAGAEAVVAWKKEAGSPGTYPLFGATTYGTLPTFAAANLATFAELPTVVDYDANVQVFGAGAYIALGDSQDQRYSEITLPARLGSKALITSCLLGGTGFKGLDDVAIYVGASNANSDGWGNIYRFCKCTRIQIEFTEHREIMVTPTFRSLGAPDPAVSLLSPSVSDLSNSGVTNPLSWVHFAECTIGGTDYRGDITGLSVTLDNNVIADNTRYVGTGGDSVPINRAAAALKPGQQRNNQGTLQLNSRLDAALVNGAALSGQWGDIAATCSDAGVGGSQTFVLTLSRCRSQQRTQQGGEPSNQLLYSAAFAFAGMTSA